MGEDRKQQEEVEGKRWQDFQNQQVQCLLELREAQVDAEGELRLEHLRQVSGWHPGGLPAAHSSPAV